MMGGGFLSVDPITFLTKTVFQYRQIKNVLQGFVVLTRGDPPLVYF